MIMVLVTMRKLLKFILLKMVFSICDTLRKIRKSSRSFSRAANRADEEPWKRKKKMMKIIIYQIENQF